MDRRDFLRQVAAWSLASAAIPCIDITPAGAAAAAVAPPVVAVARGKDYAALVSQAIAQLGGMKAFVKPGDRVVVKPNIGWDRNPAQGATSHPEVVKAVVRLALDAGAKQVRVFDRTCNDMRRCYEASGILAAVQSLQDPRATCPYVEDRHFIPVQIKNGKAMTQWDLHRHALEADCYINVPIAKHHCLAKLTLGLKNVMGVCGGNRGKIHQAMGQNLADLATVIRPRLTIIDATRILLRNGPQGGDLKDVKVLDTLVASADPVAADAYATTLFGLKPEEVESTVAAHRMQLGEMDLTRIRIVEV